MASWMSRSAIEKLDHDGGAPIRDGSEIIFDFLCQPCLTESLNVEAFGYCTKCKEYLCKTCFECHRKTSALRNHKLLQGTDMPKSKPSNVLTEPCSTHPGKLLTYFCRSHNQLCCTDCMNLTHESCKVISHIPSVSKGIAKSKEYKQLMKDLNTMVNKVTKQQDRIRLYNQDNDKYQSEALLRIRCFRQDVDKLLDQFQKKAMMNLSEMNRKNMEKIESALTDCQDVISDVTTMISGMDATAKSGMDNQLYVDMKLTRQRLTAMEATDIPECKIVRYGFHQDEKLKEMTAALSAIWSLSVRQDGEETKARYCREVCVKNNDDKNDCIISGVEVLPGDRIVVSDLANECIKMVNIITNTVTSRVSLSSTPQDLTVVESRQVAVLLGYECKIEMFTVTDGLSRIRTLEIVECGYGLCYTELKFILACPNERTLKILDMSGALMSIISADKNGTPLFLEPICVTAGRDKGVIYVSDEMAHTVTTMTLSGHIISVYKSDALQNPVRVTVGPGDRVYVCSSDTHDIHELSATGQFQQIILDGTTLTYPRNIAYDDSTDRLYITDGALGARELNYVKLFLLEKN